MRWRAGPAASQIANHLGLRRQLLKSVVSKWKEWTAKELGIHWQRDFFEHRLRHDESRREKVDYFLQNPVRRKLVVCSEDWPFVYFGDGEKPRFDR